MKRVGSGRVARGVLALAAGLALGAAVAGAAQAESFDAGLKAFKPYAVSKIDAALAGAQELKAKVEAKDLAGAQAAWKKARIGWEGAEIFTGEFFSELDEQVDAWPDAKSGFHAIEAPLFAGKIDEVAPMVDGLVNNLAEFDTKLKAADFAFTAQGLMNGTAGLAYEIGDNKSKGGESQFAGTSLTDMRNNVIGIEAAYQTVFEKPLKAKDGKLAHKIYEEIEHVEKLLKVAAFKDLDQDKLRKQSESLAVELQEAAPKLGLEKPKLEE
jgi:iron uptake system EfeUOB component EfeO/EfeM